MITIDFTTKPKEIISEYVTDEYGYKHLFDENGKLHSYNDLPAIIASGGAKYWYNHGKHHRDNDLPAVVYPDGSKFWFKNGNYHRDNDLPAIVWSDGQTQHWVNGIRVK